MELIKQELLPPVLRPPVSGELEIALVSILIRNAPIEKIKEVLRLVMIKIGLRAQNWPTDEEKLVLIEHIVNNYGGHTLQEVKLAFDMAIADKLEVEVNSFENFSCLYFSSVMNAYRQWARQEVKHLPDSTQKELPPPENLEEMTDEEYVQMVYRTWLVRKNLGYITPKCYGILVNQGKINLTQEQKDKMFEQMEFNLKTKMNSDKNFFQELNPIYQSPNKEHWKSRVFNECKKKAVELYFKTL